MKMTAKINIISVLLAGIIFFQLNAFYLIDNGHFPIQFQDMAILFEIIFFIVAYRRIDRNQRQEFNCLFFIPLILACTSAIMGYVRYQQPFFMGLRSQRAWIFSMLMYYPLSKVIKEHRYSVQKLLKLIDIINFIYFILLFVQFVLGNKVVFLKASASQRYGSIRLYVTTSFMLISYSLHLWKILTRKRIKAVDCFFVCSTLFTYFFITKARMAMVALIGATAIVLFKQRLTGRKLWMLSLAIVGLCVFLNTNAGTEILQLAFGSGNSVTGNDTSAIRDIGRAFYISELTSSFKTLIFGCGFINIDWEPTLRAVRYSENIFTADNGIFGIVFMYGLSFLAWVIIVYYKYIKKSLKYNNDFGVCIFIVGILGCYSLYPECYQTNMAFTITCVVLETLICNQMKNVS